MEAGITSSGDAGSILTDRRAIGNRATYAMITAIVVAVCLTCIVVQMVSRSTISDHTFAVNAFIDTVNKFDHEEYQHSIRETQTGEVIEDVKNMKSEIGVIALSDFNKNFFPLNKKFKLTDILVDKWEDNIKLIYEEVIKDLNKICDK